MLALRRFLRTGSVAMVLFGLMFAVSQATPALRNSPFGALAADTTAGDRVALVSHGYDALLLRVHLIRNAQTSIEVQTFIWSNDECGRLIMYELLEAARRGVKVRIIADSLFSEKDPDVAAFVATASPNLEIKHYRPSLSHLKPSLVHTAVATAQSFHDINQRMHSKVMLFDGKVLITGGRNIDNAYFDHSTVMNYRDRDVVVVGPAVDAAATGFEEFWKYKHAVASKDLVDVAAAIEKNTFRRFTSRADFDFGSYFVALDQEANDSALVRTRFVERMRKVEKATFISDEPGKSRGFFSKSARITRELRKTLESAQESVVLQTPYLVLSNPARDVIRTMQRRHPLLKITVSSNSYGSTDNLYAYSANYRLRNRYVDDLRLRVFEFKPQPGALMSLFPHYEEIAALARARIAERKQARMPFVSIHAKSMVVDDRVAFVGSYNLDPRSENLNTEVGLLIEDGVIARELRSEIETDMRPENSWVIARRSLPLGLDVVNSLIGGVLSLSPIDVWPIQNTSSFELKPGAAEVAPDDPAFYSRYIEAGAFPGAEDALAPKEILTRLYKAVGAPLTPIL
jgi:phosphatidylserine/phosphatidylglycerophosphate/cardiolipin synthase-like enzyme